MNNFIYHNPVKIVFGKGSIKELSELIPKESKILMTYGGGSIKKNGVYEQVKSALKDFNVLEFGGIEPNPRYETLMKAVDICKNEKIDFLLSVGGGSVLDGTKFISAAAKYENGDPWDILSKDAEIKDAIPLGDVLTLSATGSEMNMWAVISRESTKEKLAFGHPLVYPKFSILDPETTFSLSEWQTANGIVDAFVHVLEQYMTYPVNALVQDRFAEALLKILIEEGPKAIKNPKDYDTRANIMWAATQALNGNIGVGVPQDWATHSIGHELTAFYGLDHARTLAIVLPGVWKHQKAAKEEKLKQYAKQVWNYEGSDSVDKAIEFTEQFFRSLGMKTKLKENGIGEEKFEEIANRFEIRNQKLGEHQNIGKKEVIEILKLCLE
ncbi:iron-containing alcohol dehydrogenase [Rosettibacter firmus]|uniref:iron-containing alcohol dehydrogenase n=1 Tax=Rosettibacter firmus TaxID=3111522 RepID=UPI00336BDE73